MKRSGAEGEEDWRHGGFALYVHWPYCASKCPYCDFNSYVADHVKHAAWEKAYVTEIHRVAALAPRRTLDSIFFGGGTPSLMAPATVDSVIAAARAAWPTRNSIEITLEANPSSVEAAKFQDYSAAGVNRISLGLQSLSDSHLKMLGRRHTAIEGMHAWDIANAVFERTSFDLIYARQHQEIEQWRDELKAALALRPKHMSLYQLTIEEGTAFGDRYKLGKLKGLPSDDLSADLYETTQEQCEKAGLPAYEVSNHAAPNEESRHNLVYWRYGDYVGIGPGAHGRLTLAGSRYAFENCKNPSSWLKGVRGGNLSHEMRTKLSDHDQAVEYLLMGLRLREGVKIGRWLEIAGKETPPYTLQPLISEGFLWSDGTVFGTTSTGRQLLDSILQALI